MPVLTHKNFSVTKCNLKYDPRYSLKRRMGPSIPIAERTKCQVALEDLQFFDKLSHGGGYEITSNVQKKPA